MTRRSIPIGVLVWACVVTAGSAITWSVINAAGDQVLSSDEVMPELPAVSRAVGQHPGPPAPEGRKGRLSAGRPSPTPAGSPGVLPAATSPYTEGTWQGAGGALLAGCTGSRIDLQSATPDDGYRVEVGSRGPRQVEVTFESEADGQTAVSAVCSRGAPAFREQHGASDD